MKKDCTVKITDVQYENGKREIVEVTTQGIFHGTSGNYTLEFEETFDEDMTSHTLLTAKDKKYVSIVRGGDITTELTVECGKRHNCHYCTPYGDMLLGICANQIQDNITENGGVLKLVYSVDYYANVAAKKEMLIEVTF